MARNRVQFQKGYSLTQFMDEYGSEEKCTRRCFVGVGRTGSFAQSGHWRHQSRALYQRPCRHQDSLEAAASHLVPGDVPDDADEEPLGLSVSYNTAWKVKHS